MSKGGMRRIHPHLGRLIENRLKEVGMAKSELARRISTSRQNVMLILKKEVMATDMLLRICGALNHDFFQYLSKGDGREKPKVYIVVTLPDDDDEQTRIVRGIDSLL